MADISDYEDEDDARIKNNKPSLVESLFKLRKSVGKGNYNDVRIQSEVISYIADECGFDLENFTDPTKHKEFSLKPILERVRVKFLPMMSNTRTIRRWFIFFIEHRVTMATRRKEVFLNRRGSRRHRRNIRHGTRSNRRFFSPHDTDCLMWLINYCHQYFIDEFQADLLRMTGNKFSISCIYRQIRRCGYSSQNFFICAAEIDQRERIEYKLRLHTMCFSPEMLVAIDVTAKVKINGVRDRMWARVETKFTPYLNPFFVTRKQRYSMIAAADIDGFILEACSVIRRENSANDADLTRGTVGRERFKTWLRENLLPCLGNYALREKKTFIGVN